MTSLTYRSFVCPGCLRVTTKPWDEVWCPCERGVALQPYDANPRSVEIVWTRMRVLPAEVLRAWLDDANPESHLTDEEKRAVAFCVDWTRGKASEYGPPLSQDQVLASALEKLRGPCSECGLTGEHKLQCSLRVGGQLKVTARKLPDGTFVTGDEGGST